MTNIRYLTLLIFFSFLYSNLLGATPILQVTEKFVVVSVNGKSFSNGILARDAKIPLNIGINKIALRYKELFEGQYGDDHDIISSDIFVIQTTINKDQTYTLQYLKPTDASAARRYAKEPIINIVDHQGHSMKVENTYLAAQSEGFVNQATRINIPAQQMISITSPKKIAVQEPTDSTSEQAMAEQMLMFWWNKADDKQRRAFLEQIKAKQ